MERQIYERVIVKSKSFDVRNTVYRSACSTSVSRNNPIEMRHINRRV